MSQKYHTVQYLVEASFCLLQTRTCSVFVKSRTGRYLGLTAVSFKYSALLSDPGLGFHQRGNDVELTLCDSALYTSKALPRILW
ncbi:hypothetical protein CYMTET_37213 [Cymbomonas tetramitiformis]|uniref:Uncharacterized protein n=1 Tax=Cymbomonas tetramitiformis TaxID=36881 RepID=A0AAE0CEF4_9CHLO|nr:hypothetical protein CYMTET_37213 [Cymbomonas tetramitiformis]